MHINHTRFFLKMAWLVLGTAASAYVLHLSLSVIGELLHIKNSSAALLLEMLLGTFSAMLVAQILEGTLKIICYVMAYRQVSALVREMNACD